MPNWDARACAASGLASARQVISTSSRAASAGKCAPLIVPAPNIPKRNFAIAPLLDRQTLFHLLELLLTDPANLHDVLDPQEPPVLAPEIQDRLCRRRSHAGKLV